MNDSRILSFWTAKATAESGPNPRVLSIYPQGEFNGTEIQFMAPSNMPLDEQLAGANRVLATVQLWRDGIAQEIERKRTAEDELTEARARIAELEKAAAGSDAR
jgi:hypothetical protein